MTQTNVTFSITATFKAAHVLSYTEYQRVSCTGIQCAIATFACSEGGFDMTFKFIEEINIKSDAKDERL